MCFRVKAKRKRSTSQASEETAVDSPLPPPKAVEEEPREEVPEAKKKKTAASTELATMAQDAPSAPGAEGMEKDSAVGAEKLAEADSTRTPEGGSESQTPGKASLEIDTEAATDVGASAVKQKADSAEEPVVTGETVAVEVDGATGTTIAVGVEAAE